jgi:hypothetical protein
MYQYEGGEKKKNVGFSRVEAKGGQCKITLHMQMVGQLDSIFPIYLIQRGQNNLELIYLGDAILKNQIMDSKLTADETNIMGTGFQLSDMGGLLLFLNDNVFYATEWDDKPIVMQEVLEALRPKDKRVQKAQAGAPSKFRDITTLEEAVQQRTLTEELSIPRYKLPGGWKMVERLQYETVRNTEQNDQNQDSLLHYILNQVNRETDEAVTKQNELEQRLSEISKTAASSAKDRNENMEKNMDDSRKGSTAENIDDDIKEAVQGDKLSSTEQEYEKWDMDDLNIVDQDVNKPENSIAVRILESHQRIYPFEDNEVIQCVKIEPKDIELLPKEIWPYSNNSFLMHGFYCYHHLIFAKMKTHSGFRYVLGIPGIYHNREQFMARMFGFECFKSIKKRELKQGDFGYWYLPVSF